MSNYGTVKRTYPRVEVLRGYNPQSSLTITQAHPVKSGETILSGQVISPKLNVASGKFEWIKGIEDANAIPYIAINDSADWDVVAAGKLPALSSLGQFEIQTAFFKAADAASLVEGAPLTPDGTTGNLKVTTRESGEPIVGFVTRNNGPVNVAKYNSSAVLTNGQLLVISFQTSYHPNTVDNT